MSVDSVLLGDIAEITGGGSLKLSGTDFVEAGIPAWGAGGQNGFVAKAEGHGPAVILSAIGARCGKCFYVEGEWTTLANTQIIRPITSLADARYLWYQLNDEGRWHRSGSGQPFIKPSDVRRHRVKLPPLAEQRRIARVLDAGRRVIAKRQEAMIELENLKESLVDEVFRSENHDARPLSEVLDSVTSGSRGWARYYADQGDLFLRIQNVKRNELVLDDVAHVAAPHTKEAERTRVRPGDVILSITADLGRTAVVPEFVPTAYINQHLAVLRSDALNPHYLSSGLSSRRGQAQLLKRNRQGVKAGLNFDDIRSVRLPCPPRSEQDAFAARMVGVDVARRVARQHLEALETLFASLHHRAFTGAL